MTDKTAGGPAERIGNKIRFSIVLKLNVRLLLRLFGIFVALDFFLCAAAAVGTAVYAESSLGAVADEIGRAGLPAEDSGKWLVTAGYSVAPLAQPMRGYTVPAVFRSLFPKSTAASARSVSLSAAAGASFFKRLEGLSFRVGLYENGAPYALSLSLGLEAAVFLRVMAVLLAAEFLMLVRSVFTGARTIRRTLRPIAELAETTNHLNREGAFSPEEMEKLAGKLNGINAARLDTRISLDSTQDELKNLAASINGLLDRINESYRAQVRFVSDASHELRTPISVIQGYANLLDRWGKKDEKTMQESIDAIKEETANMKQLVEQLLFLARGDNNTMALQRERFDLSALAGEVVGETKMIDSGHEYASSLQPAFLYADQSLVKQSMRILMDNAIKYTPAGGHISVFVFEKESSAWLSVQDEGIGIPPEAVPKIFDRFFRADESRARATGGTGLGLSIAKWIAERHGGHMEVLSRENLGTRVSIVFPSAS